MAERAPRVGYLLKKFPRLSETFVLHEILEQQRQGVDVHVLSLYPPDEGRFHADVARLNNPVVYLPEMHPRELFRGGRGRALAALLARSTPALEYALGLGELDGLPVLKRLLPVAFEVERLGIEHLHAHFATIAARTALAVKLLCGVPFSVTAHAKDIYRETVKPDAFARIVDEAEFLVTVCDANRDYILRELAPGRDDKVVRLYNGVDLDRFRPLESVAGPPVPARGLRPPASGLQPPASGLPPLRILAVGRLVPKKGFHVLLDACALLHARGLHFSCDLVGDGEERDALSARIEHLGLGVRVRMRGALSQDAVVPLCQAADVACLPCMTDDEGNRDALPTTLLEAMGCGKPVVSTPVGGVPEIVTEGETGLLVPEGDAPALAAALSALAADPELREGMGAAGRKKAEREFDLRKNVATLHGLLLRERAGAALAAGAVA